MFRSSVCSPQTLRTGVLICRTPSLQQMECLHSCHSSAAWAHCWPGARSSCHLHLAAQIDNQQTIVDCGSILILCSCSRQPAKGPRGCCCWHFGSCTRRNRGHEELHAFKKLTVAAAPAAAPAAEPAAEGTAEAEAPALAPAVAPAALKAPATGGLAPRARMVINLHRLWRRQDRPSKAGEADDDSNRLVAIADAGGIAPLVAL